MPEGFPVALMTSSLTLDAITAREEDAVVVDYFLKGNFSSQSFVHETPQFSSSLSKRAVPARKDGSLRIVPIKVGSYRVLPIRVVCLRMVPIKVGCIQV